MKRLLALLIILAAQTAYAQPSPIPSYTTLQDSGTARVQRRIANFSGALTVADDSGNLRSNVTVASGGITNTMLANPSLTVSTTSPLGGGGLVALGGTLTLTCASCLTGTPTAIGDLLYSTSGGQALSKLADVAVGSYLRSGGVATAPLWSTLKLPNAATTGDLAVATGTNTLGSLADVATGSVLVSGGVGSLPVWSTALPSGVLPNVGPGPGTFTWSTGDSVTLDAQGRTTAVTPVVRTLTGGTGINTIGTLAADRTISVDQTFSPTWTGTHTFTLSPVVGVGTGTTKSILFSNATGPGTLSWNPSAARTLTLPDATDTIVARATTDTLTNKTISGSSNTLSNIANGSLTNSSVTINAPSAVFAGSGAVSLGASLTLTLQTQTANTVWAGPTTGVATAPTFRALVAADIPSLSGTYLPLAGGVMSGAITLSGTQLGTYTLGGTPTLGANLGISTSATFHIGDTTHLLTNIATGRVIGGASNTNGHIVPNVADDTFDLIATAQTLTNKTISGSSNTLSNIANGSLTNSSLTVATTAPLGGGGSISLGGTATLTCTTCLVGTPSAIGDIVYSTSGGQSFTALADVLVGSYLRSGGVATAPLWSTLKLPNTATTGDLMVATGTNTVGSVADVATNQALLSGGVGVVPTWGTVPNAALTNSSITIATTSPLGGGGTVALGATATSLTCTTCLTGVPTAIGDLMYSTAGGQSFTALADVAIGKVLISGGVATAPTWGNVPAAALPANLLTGSLTSGVTPVATGANTLGNSNFTMAGNVFDVAAGATIFIGNGVATAVSVGSTNIVTYLGGTGPSTGTGSARIFNPLYSIGSAATSGTTLVNSPFHYFQSNYWNGTASTTLYGGIRMVPTSTTPHGYMSIGIGLASPSDVIHIDDLGNVNVLAGGAVDTITAGTLGFGVATATGVGIGHSGITTTITGALTQLTGAFSLTGSSQSQLTTTAGSLVLDSAGTALVDIGVTTTSAIAVGRSGVTTTITGGLTQLTGAVSLTGNGASSFTTSSGALTLTSAANATWSTGGGTLQTGSVIATASSLQLESTSNSIVIGGATAAGVSIGRAGTLITVPGGTIRAVTPAAGGGAGVAMQIGPGNGGAANGVGNPAGAGGQTSLQGGVGGNGDASNAPAAGANILVVSGQPGAVGAFGGGANSGDINNNIPAPSGTGTSGIYRWEFASGTSPGLAMSPTQLSIALDAIVYGQAGTATKTIIGAQQGTASTVGGALVIAASGGGNSAGVSAGGVGGSSTFRAAVGGNGSGAQNPGAGGQTNLIGGPGGTGGSGNANGGSVVIDGGSAQGTGTGGLVLLGNATATSSITIGHTGMPSGITMQTGSGGLSIQGATASGTIAITQSVSSGTVVPAFTVNSGAHTNLTATTEFFDNNFNMARTETWATGNITTQRAAVFQAPTYAFAGASTITNTATVAITGAPTAGTNATLTNKYSLWVQGGLSRFDGSGIQFPDGTIQATAAAGGSTTLSAVYSAGTSSANQTMALSSSNGGGVSIRDNATPLATPLFTVANSTGSTPYLLVLANFISVGGTVSPTLPNTYDLGQDGSAFINVWASNFSPGGTALTDTNGILATVSAQNGGVGSAVNGGNGGSLNLFSGFGGQGSGSVGAGLGGTVGLQSGAGGASAGSGPGQAAGTLTINGGAGGAGTGSLSGGAGGSLVLFAGGGGNAAGSGATSGAAGTISITGGFAGGFATGGTGVVGGSVTITGGTAAASSVQAGGVVSINGGPGAAGSFGISPGVGGGITIAAASGGAIFGAGSAVTGAVGGAVSINAGQGSSGVSTPATTPGVGGVLTVAGGAGGDGSGSTAGAIGGAATVSGGRGGQNNNGSGSGTGGTLTVSGGAGGQTFFNTIVGGTGGVLTVAGGIGGAGSTTGAPGPGGALVIAGGAGGTIGSTGTAVGGAVSINGGVPTGAAAAGAITIGTTTAASIGIGKSGVTTTITGTTTHVGAMGQSGGAFTLSGNAASSIVTTSGALTITSLAGSGATWSTGDGGVLAAAFDRTSGGTLQLGITTATAIQVAQSGVKTTFNGPVNVASQAAPGSPANGDVWTDSTRGALSTRQLGLTQQLEGTMFASTATANVATATTATLVGTGIGTQTTPANFCSVGKTIHLHTGGIMTTSGTPGSWTWLVKIGATTVATSGAITPGASLTNKGFSVDAYLVYRTCGASGTVMVDGTVSYPSAAGARGWGELNNAGATTTINTTGTLVIDDQITLSAASQSISGTYTNIEIMN